MGKGAASVNCEGSRERRARTDTPREKIYGYNVNPISPSACPFLFLSSLLSLPLPLSS